MRFFFLLFFVLFLSACLSDQVLVDDCVESVCFDDVCFSVEVPMTSDDFLQGLMFREYLPSDEGMLFVFNDEQEYAFWMKNTLIPLDIIWINSLREVVYIAGAVPCVEDPCTIYAPNASALFVLEINRGLASSNNIVLGSIASINLCN